ncbi:MULTISPECIES: DUF6247 family protein [unclassified Crossiella]|uniref:DUF6247 family protein n=1 Tax=unclassified Crossiella TaxID=2620835 RepID=UPI001FFF18EC|nr:MULTISPECIES: DUF6247 family protein [unclassified Crossiella]MCK2240121.1 DUF6247 family protein [Crossiella sp. S99.2]MCK2253427.1 DUF6247 family protein [Crossiella sp. S99.1]
MRLGPGHPDWVDVAKTGPAVWAALEGEARSMFEEVFRAALVQAAEDFDLAPVQEVVHAWWPMAILGANPDPEVEAEIKRFRDSGEDFSLLPPPIRDEDEARP